MAASALLQVGAWDAGGFLGGDVASGFLAGVVVGVLLGLAIGAIGAPLLGAGHASRRQDREDGRLLRAFLELSDRDPSLPVAVHEVRELAKVPVLGDGLERLQRKGHIAKHPDGPYWFVLTDEGRRAASERRARWRRAFGG